MSNTTIALNLHVRDYLSEEVLESLSEALMKELSKLALATLEKVAADNGIAHKVDASVLAKEVEKSAITGPSAKEALEVLAVRCEERALKSDVAVFAALSATPDTSDPDALKDIHIESGIAGGFLAAAGYAREAIEAL
jgi:hypothetical protein